MRAWLAESRLTAVLNNPAPNADEHELLNVQEMLRKNKVVRGTLMVDELPTDAEHRELSRPIERYEYVDLEKEKIYEGVLQHLQQRYPRIGILDWDEGLFSDGPVLPKR
jgi:hypothetical protein